ncbi:hypothetical protein Pstr01_40740 [Pseudomonas straminea]|nr:hypothetical protein Pstr01_40740 [Pseudomonas straminea]
MATLLAQSVLGFEQRLAQHLLFGIERGLIDDVVDLGGLEHKHLSLNGECRLGALRRSVQASTPLAATNRHITVAPRPC